MNSDQEKNIDKNAEDQKKIKQKNKKINGFALLLFALVIVTAFPAESKNYLCWGGLLIGLIGLFNVLDSSWH